MNTEQLHDALNHLDDDLIEAVDTLRSQKKKKLPLFRIAGLAACVCLLVGIGFLRSGFGRSDNVHQESANMETIADMQTNYGSAGGTTVYSIRLSNVEQADGSLSGTVADGSEATLFPAGTQVTVVFPSAPETALDGPLYRWPGTVSGSTENTESKKPGEMTVFFTRWEETENGIVICIGSMEGE